MRGGGRYEGLGGESETGKKRVGTSGGREGEREGGRFVLGYVGVTYV